MIFRLFIDSPPPLILACKEKALLKFGGMLCKFFFPPYQKMRNTLADMIKAIQILHFAEHLNFLNFNMDSSFSLRLLSPWFEAINFL